MKDNRSEKEYSNTLTLESSLIADIENPDTDYNIIVQKVTINEKTNDEPINTRTAIKFELSMEELIQLDENAGNLFVEQKTNEFWSILERNQSLDPNTTNREEARQRIHESINGDDRRLFVSITYDRSLGDVGFFSQKFITQESQLNLPFIFDGPFQLTQNRESLNLTEADFESINQPLLELFGKFYDLVIETIFRILKTMRLIYP